MMKDSRFSKMKQEVMYSTEMETSYSIQVTISDMVAAYAKGGAKPQPIVRFGEQLLKEGMDYTLSYKNNKNVGDNAQVVIKFKGNFENKIEKAFTITGQELSNLKVGVNDKRYDSKKGA